MENSLRVFMFQWENQKPGFLNGLIDISPVKINGMLTSQEPQSKSPEK
jgi:hypothetical protein